MVIRSTVLLPKLQYVIRVIQGNELSESVHMIEEFRALQDEIKILKEDSIWLDSLIEWLKAYQNDKDTAKAKLDKLINDEKSCNQCLTCHNCLKLFWIEIFSFFYDDKYIDMYKELQGENYLIFRNLPQRLYEHIDVKYKASEYYWRRCLELRKYQEFKNCLVVLKGMSSSTPAVLNGAFGGNQYHGGGFYLNVKGVGIAVDPGYHFIDNLHKEGISVYDIDVVIITHEHIDHSNDMRLLDDLNYSIFSYSKKIGKPHTIDWYVDEITYELIKTLRKNNSGFSYKSNNIYYVDPLSQKLICQQVQITEEEEILVDEQIEILSSGVELASGLNCHFFMTNHEKRDGEDNFLQHTFGVYFEAVMGEVERKIFFTSDTKFTKEIANVAVGADIVIANISSVYEDDLLNLRFKSDQLGFKGCYHLLEAMKEKPPQFFLISEFWNGKSDIRFDIAQYLKREIMSLDEGYKNTNIVPSEIGMKIDMEHLNMQCSYCGTFKEQFHIVRPREDYKEIKCVCSKCYF